jgi:dTDP-4-dehydrorhamnose reductase
MYLIVGANGFLGSYLIKNILENTDDSILATDLMCPDENRERVHWQKCDITKEADVIKLNETTKKDPNLKILYLPVFFNVNKNPANDKIAWSVNVTSYARFVDIMENVKVFYSLSTDMLYKTSREIPYTEHDLIDPMNDYARHKAIEERMAEAKGYNIVRLPVMTAPSLSPIKKHFFDEVVSNLQHGQSMQFFTDSRRSMIDFDTVAKTLITLTNTPEAQKEPILNVAGDESLSKYDFALRLADKYGLNKDLIIPVSMDDDTTIWKEKRPKTVLLDNTRVKHLLGLKELKMKI